MVNFAKFLTDNGIKKKDIAAFLDVSPAFITQLCDGSKDLPNPQRLKIVNSDRGWDTSMLEDHEKVTYSAHSEGGDAFFGSKVVKGTDIALKLQIKALIDQIDILKEQLRTQEQQYEKRLAEERARTQREKDLVDSLMKMMNK